MSLAPDAHTYRVPIIDRSRLGRALIAQPNEDVRDLLAEHCRRLGVEPVTDHIDGDGRLPDVDVIVAEPASSEGKQLLALHAAQGSAIPLVFVSVYPPVGVVSSPAVAYLVMPCSRERFDSAVTTALAKSSGR